MQDVIIPASPADEVVIAFLVETSKRGFITQIQRASVVGWRIGAVPTAMPILNITIPPNALIGTIQRDGSVVTGGIFCSSVEDFRLYAINKTLDSCRRVSKLFRKHNKANPDATAEEIIKAVERELCLPKPGMHP